MSLQSDLIAIRSKRPVILNLTNYVSMDFVANSLLALGASPLMSTEPREFGELVKIADAVCINLGTLDCAFAASAIELVKKSASQNKPVVLDPVGANATEIRRQTACTLIELGVTAVRANHAEIAALIGHKGQSTGIDSQTLAENIEGPLLKYAAKRALTWVSSGKLDLVITEKSCARVPYGDPWMAEVTGMGCTASSAVAAFLSAQKDPHQAALHAMTHMGQCGEKAREKSQGPGSFKTAFIDALYTGAL